MPGPVEWILNPMRDPHATTDVRDYAPAVRRDIAAFHRTFPGYDPTPLHSLPALADRLKLDTVLVKDESPRFGLNAFKGLGAAHAIGRYLSRKAGVDGLLPFDRLRSEEVRERAGTPVFITATDGNHGRGVAWTAGQLGCEAVVYMPRGAAPARLGHIRDLGARAMVTDLNYDDSVRLAARDAEANGWVLVQDTAWPGYETVPAWIMQGYATIMHEVLESLEGGPLPTHVILQAGVGSFAGAMLNCLLADLGADAPAAIIVEPANAACLYRSVGVGDGETHAVGGALQTIMAGLACGEPSIIAWPVLRDHALAFFSCPDSLAATGMRILGNPLAEDPRVISGESGAVGAGLLAWLRGAGTEAASAVGLNENSRVLLISTEGDTDPDGYRDAVWNGTYPMSEVEG